MRLRPYRTIDNKIDGAVINPSEYFVYDHTFLVRKNGARWPRCQALDRDDTEAGTFSVTYTYGRTPPLAGQLAVAEYAWDRIPVDGAGHDHSFVRSGKAFAHLSPLRLALPAVRGLIERHHASGIPLDLTIAYANVRDMGRNTAERRPDRQAEIKKNYKAIFKRTRESPAASTRRSSTIGPASASASACCRPTSAMRSSSARAIGSPRLPGSTGASP